MLTLTVRPASTFCNARCEYCYHEGMKFVQKDVMSLDTLETLISDYQGGKYNQLRYVWHGGEPTLAGLDFYRSAIELQKKYQRPEQVIRNSMQTNAWVVNESWAELFAENEFGLGISLDGPKKLNDLQRGNGYFQRTMKAISLLQEKTIEFSVICVVTSKTVSEPDVVFDFFIKSGFKSISFNPVFGEHGGYDVDQHDFANFLKRIYDLWTVGQHEEISIRFLEESVLTMMGGNTSLCMMQGGCQNHLVVEHDGTIMPCHSHAGDLTSVGKLGATTLEEASHHEYFKPIQTLVDSGCQSCRWYALCGGDCVRFIDPDAEIVKSSFCSARKEVFSHIEGDLLEKKYLEDSYDGKGSRLAQMLSPYV